MNRPLLFAVVWFALGEVLAICGGNAWQVGVLVGMPAFCVLWVLRGRRICDSEGKSLAKYLWLGYIMLVLGFVFAKLFAWNMQAEKVVFDVLEKSGEDSVYVVGYGAVDEIMVKESSDEDDESERTYNIIVKLDTILLTDTDGTDIEISDSCRVIIYGAGEEYMLGSGVTLSGDIYAFKNADNPGAFDMKKYYRSRDISFCMYECDMEVCGEGYSILKQALYEFKNACAKRLRLITDEDTANIYRGILLGDKYDIDSTIKMSFQLVGIGHILAISGLHISLLAGLIYKLLRKIGLKLYIASPLTIVMLVLYGMMTGFGVATIRAVAMMALMLLGELLGKDYDILTADGVALFIMLIANPYRVYDGGMWLSVVAIVGVYAGLKISGIFVKVLASKTKKLKKLILENLVSSVVVAFSINLATFPVMLLLYYQFCPYSVLINLIIIPLMTVVVACGIASLVITSFLGAVTVSLGAYAIYPGTWLLKFYMKLCDVTMDLPEYVINTGKPVFSQVLVYYVTVAVVYLLLFGRKVRKKQLRTKHYKPGVKNVSCAFVMMILCVGIIVGVAIDNGREKMIFMSVGQGDAIAIRTEDGINICVDGGSTSKNETGRYIIAPCLKSQRMARVDYWFVSHTDEDHISGLTELLELGRLSGVQIKNIVFSKYVVKDDGFENLCALAEEIGVNIIYMDYLDMLNTDKFKLTCYYPKEGEITDDKNAASLVLCYESDLITLWLTGDVGTEGMDEVAKELQGEDVAWQGENEHITILKMPHHGSRYSISEEFYAGTCPDIAVISCGKNNLYGHPHTETMEALDEYDIPSLITWQSGAVVVETRKGSVSVKGYGDVYNP